MAYPLQERYINLLTDFGFKRVFGTEPNKALLIDFLNTLLPPHHRIRDVTYKRNENLGNTTLDRKAIFDIYCEGETGEKFIVEIQKAKQNFFKDRSVYYATFPIQEQAEKGDWDYRLKAVYTVGVLDFVFDDHQNEETLIHTVQLKNQNCEVFYDKLNFVYIELPKFTKPLEELETRLDKWLFLLRYLPELSEPPDPLEESIFSQLFEVAEIANFSPPERDSYENSLKYYRDLNNVVNTSREEGLEEGLVRGRLEGTRTLILRLLSRSLGELPTSLLERINRLSPLELDTLSEALLDFSNLEDLVIWLDRFTSAEDEFSDGAED
ncbi:Rpn family recombination-promoting nuclease/putative transposase [Oscillatoriales cyanobacterium LEGE 11467]|uniref:Rpn family recombination-promoting nuclease/putative transposase n=1 Tax=Zarconia navalis LEGE 11467 TaxID=1828826 RepID=A0A928ZA52_9CYAN|nr:Rpn family recombination-promoting nuclease/putative transposase [Zarconia navalis]MBE9041396.1 Rpn family recombination-promoting nuclease/putative transposase [Zarconia navalis LEGE 11467]